MTGKSIVLSLLLVCVVQTLSAEPQIAAQDGEKASKQPSRPMVQQKLQLVKMMLSTSEALERASRKDDVEIKKQVAAVLARYAAANDALNAGNLVRAEELADESLNLLENLSRLPPDPQQAAATERQHYEESLKEMRSIEATYQDLRRRVAPQSKGSSFSTEQLRKQTDQARELANAGRYQEAGDLLKEAHAKIIAALNNLLGATALSYELKFKSVAEEYDYELARYHSYEELAPIAYAELHPDKNTIMLSERYVQQSRELCDTAKNQAAQGDHKAAIETLLEAIRRVQTALRLVGLVLQE